jgi:hypothetical protein
LVSPSVVAYHSSPHQCAWPCQKGISQHHPRLDPAPSHPGRHCRRDRCLSRTVNLSQTRHPRTSLQTPRLRAPSDPPGVPLQAPRVPGLKGASPTTRTHSRGLRPAPRPARSAGKEISPFCQENLPPLTLKLGSNCGTTRTPLWRRSPQGATICNACGLYQKARNTARPTKLNRTGISLASEPRVSPVKPSTSAAKSGKCGSGSTYYAADQVSTGTCPGGGRCNGTGGAEGCNGCPAFNNRLSKRAQLNTKGQASGHKSTETAEAQPIDVAALKAQQTPNNTPMVIACQNCATTITPLWRRDEGGHTICNACGMLFKPRTRYVRIRRD